MALKKRQEKLNLKENLAVYLNLVKKHRGVLIFLIVLTLIIEGARIFEKFLFKVVVDKSGEFIAQTLILANFIQILFVIALVFLGVIVIKIITHWFSNKIMNRFDGMLQFDLKKKFFDHIVQLSHKFHTSHKSGSLISRLNRGERSVEALNDFFIHNLGPIVFQIIIIAGALLILDPPSALVIVTVTVLFILFSLWIANKQKIPQYQSNKAEDREKGIMGDVFTNIESVKYFGKEKFVSNRYAKLAEDTKVKMIRFWDYGVLFTAGESLILSLGTFFIIFFPILRLIQGEIGVGTLVFIYSLYMGLTGPLFRLVFGIRRFYISLGDFHALFKYLKIKNDIVDKAGAPDIEIKEGRLELNNVSFSYPKKKAQAVQNINLNIKPNEKVALVGHSGCGKTTLIKLLYRLYDTDKGQILIDGKNVKAVKQHSLRSELSIVPQEPILFDDTIYNNIRFANPKASREEVMRAIKFAQLSKIIKTFPLKENTIVGERGMKLSGGEKQRVSIARALLADKKVLVLDEATSALDSKTEYEIRVALGKLLKDKTAIIIAHRLSTIMSADRIIVMDKGKIVQEGKHRDLIKRRGIYRELWDLQRGGYIK